MANDLRKAAEMALSCLNHAVAYDRKEEHAIKQAIQALRQALAQPVDAVNMSQDRVDETAKNEHEPFIYIREDTEMPFGGYEHCGQHDAGAFPVYLAPPKREWVGLTADEIWKCNKAKSGSAVEFHICSAHQNLLDFAEAIEAKLKEKNGG